MLVDWRRLPLQKEQVPIRTFLDGAESRALLFALPGDNSPRLQASCLSFWQAWSPGLGASLAI